jgi:hypothetical protein
MESVISARNDNYLKYFWADMWKNKILENGTYMDNNTNICLMFLVCDIVDWISLP